MTCILAVSRLSTPPKDFRWDLQPFLELSAVLDLVLAFGPVAPAGIIPSVVALILLLLIPPSECFVR